MLSSDALEELPGVSPCLLLSWVHLSRRIDREEGRPARRSAVGVTEALHRSRGLDVELEALRR
jgi:hypothetical protein